MLIGIGWSCGEDEDEDWGVGVDGVAFRWTCRIDGSTYRVLVDDGRTVCGERKDYIKRLYVRPGSISGRFFWFLAFLAFGLAWDNMIQLGFRLYVCTICILWAIFALLYELWDSLYGLISGRWDMHRSCGRDAGIDRHLQSIGNDMLIRCQGMHAFCIQDTCHRWDVLPVYFYCILLFCRSNGLYEAFNLLFMSHIILTLRHPSCCLEVLLKPIWCSYPEYCLNWQLKELESFFMTFDWLHV